jgi:hypothetical protein
MNPAKVDQPWLGEDLNDPHPTFYVLCAVPVIHNSGHGRPWEWSASCLVLYSKGDCSSIQRFLEATLAAGRKLKPDFAFGCVICDNSAAEQLTIRQVKYFVDGA